MAVRFPCNSRGFSGGVTPSSKDPQPPGNPRTCPQNLAPYGPPVEAGLVAGEAAFESSSGFITAAGCSVILSAARQRRARLASTCRAGASGGGTPRWRRLRGLRRGWRPRRWRRRRRGRRDDAAGRCRRRGSRRGRRWRRSRRGSGRLAGWWRIDVLGVAAGGEPDGVRRGVKEAPRPRGRRWPDSPLTARRS